MKQADLVYQTWVVASSFSFHTALDLEKAWGEDGLWQQIQALEHRFLRPCGRFNACCAMSCDCQPRPTVLSVSAVMCQWIHCLLEHKLVSDSLKFFSDTTSYFGSKAAKDWLHLPFLICMRVYLCVEKSDLHICMTSSVWEQTPIWWVEITDFLQIENSLQRSTKVEQRAHLGNKAHTIGKVKMVTPMLNKACRSMPQTQ